MRERLTDWLAAEGCIEESEKQASGYAVASLGVVCLPVAAFLVIAAAANRVAESLVMLSGMRSFWRHHLNCFWQVRSSLHNARLNRKKCL